MFDKKFRKVYNSAINEKKESRQGTAERRSK